MKLKPIWMDINPKAVTTDELFGFLHPATREWKDGLCLCLCMCVYLCVCYNVMQRKLLV